MVYSGILALRRRSVWEAADAGLLLWRRNLGYFIPFFAIPFWVCAFALRFVPAPVFPGSPVSADSLAGSVIPLSWSWFILWWLNPLFDRLLLHVAGRRFFEPASTLRSLVRGLGRTLVRGLPGDLLWRRLSPWRAVMMPLRVLERGPGVPNRGPTRPAADRSPAAGASPPSSASGSSPASGKTPAGNENRRRIRDRRRALFSGGFHFNIFLSIWCFTLEWILLAGETLFAILISRLLFHAEWESFGQIFNGKGLYFFTAWCVNHLVVESLYVCMGFGLYLNSRVEVEGWDLELLFRGFAGRRGRGAITALLLCSLALLRPAPGFGEGAEAGTGFEIALPPELGKDRPAEDLERIIRRDLGTEKKTWGIRLKQPGDSESLLDQFNLAPWVRVFQRAGALTLRAALILAFGALALAGGIYAYRRRRAAGPSRREAPSAVPQDTPPALAEPGGLVEEAGRLYRRALPREAWALCYAAALEALSRYRNFRFPPGATEYRCLALVRGRREERQTARDFAKLIRHWVPLAYGGNPPPEGAFEESLAWVMSLCGEPPGPREKPGGAEGESHG
jgi:hypothetical protein